MVCNQHVPDPNKHEQTPDVLERGRGACRVPENMLQVGEIAVESKFPWLPCKKEWEGIEMKQNLVLNLYISTGNCT